MTLWPALCSAPSAASQRAREKLVGLGIYPFVVPFVPIGGTPLESHPAPSPEFMRSVLEPLGRMVSTAGLRASEIKAGCGKCGACSSQSTYEQ